MELDNCSWGNGSCEWAQYSKTPCLLSSCVSPTEVVAKEYFPGQALLLSLIELSKTEVTIPGTDVAVYLGNWWAIFELALIMVASVASLAACAYLGYWCRTSVRLTPETRRAFLWSEIIGVAVMPFAFMSWYGPLTSVIANFALSLCGIIGFFRLLELMCKTGPKGFDSSCLRYVVYVASPAEVVFDGEGRLQGSQPGHLKKCLADCIGHLLLMLFVLSLGRPSEFKPLLSGVDPLNMKMFGFPIALPTLHLQATYVYSMLATSIGLFRVPLAIVGIDTHNAMRHPLLLSTSVRDFWGRRWNLLIHRMMHRTFFTPLAASKWGPRAGALAAFAVSGLFHEYMWLLTNWHEAQLTLGGPLKFFVVQASLLTAEKFLKGTRVGRVVSSFPAPILTILTTLVILPFGPLFLHDLRGVFADGIAIYPHFLIAK
jgi:hypothetical protein